MKTENLDFRIKVGGQFVLVSKDDFEALMKGTESFRKLRANRARAVRRAIVEVDVFAATDAIDEYIGLISSEKRAGALLRCLDKAPPELFWDSFLRNWSDCDDTWRYQPRVANLLFRNAEAMLPVHSYNNEARGFYDGLPERVTIYRGCSRSRVAGLSWSTDQQIADSFANGHRGIHYPNPVIAVAEIDKSDILSVFVDRNEAEVLAQPKKYMIYPYIRPRYRDLRPNLATSRAWLAIAKRASHYAVFDRIWPLMIDRRPGRRVIEGGRC